MLPDETTPEGPEEWSVVSEGPQEYQMDVDTSVPVGDHLRARAAAARRAATAAAACR